MSKVKEKWINIKSYIRKFYKRFRIYISLPQIWLFFIILILAIIMLICSLNAKSGYLSSLYSNIFAGLITGVVISLLSGIRQIYIVLLERKHTWLQKLHQLIMDYKEIYLEFIKDNYNNMDREDYIYDMGAHISWVNEHILQSSFDQRLSFNTVKYSKNHYKFDAILFSEEVDKLRDNIRSGKYSEKEDVLSLFDPFERKLIDLNIDVCNEMKDIEIKIAAAQKSLL